MSHPNEAAPAAAIETDVVCMGCGCLCDDIEIRIEETRIVEARNACERGGERFMSFRQLAGPPCQIDARPASLDEGVDVAADMLSRTRLPLLLGLEGTSCEVARAAVSLADRIGGCVDSVSTDSIAATMTALQWAGEVTCTLGEIRQRSDLFVVWRADPLQSHPRLLERCGIFGDVKIAGESPRPRYLVVVDEQETKTARDAAHEFIAISPGSSYEAFSTLRALLRELEVESDGVEAATGQPVARWRLLAERMKSARYGVLMYDPTIMASSGGLDATGAHWLVRELNDHARFAVLPLGSAGNPTGARHVLAWQTGYPLAVGLHAGYPRYGPGEFSASALGERGEADVVLRISGGLAAREQCLLLINRNPTAGAPTVVSLRTAQPGLTAAGTVFRMDGVPLPLRRLIEPAYPAAEEILQRIERRILERASGEPRRLAEPRP